MRIYISIGKAHLHFDQKCADISNLEKQMIFEATEIQAVFTAIEFYCAALFRRLDGRGFFLRLFTTSKLTNI